MEKKEPESFEVKDRRRFVVDESGETKDDGQSPPGAEGQAAEAPRDDARTAKSEQAKSSPRREQRASLPEIDFSTFILSLSSSALFHLGLVENPMTHKAERDLPMAKQSIDIIVMLRDKTKGNVTPEEANLLENLIADLRLKYVNELNR